MNKKDQKYLAIIAVAAIVGAWLMGAFTQFGLPPPAFNLGTNAPSYTPTQEDKDNYAQGIGRWNVYETVADSLDPATIRTSATNYKLYWYSRQGVEWIYHETGNNKYVDLTPADGGILWVVIAIPSGQAFYVDYQKITQNNQYVTQYLYIDVDGDGAKEFAFAYDMRGHAIPNSGYPSITFMGFILTYDSSFTGLNDLSNATAIGQTTVSKYYDYYLSFNAAKKAIAIWKVEVKFNSTDETKMRLKKLNVPGLGYLDGSLFEKTYTTTDYRYTYTISRNFDGALYLKLAANAQNRFDSTLGVEYTLANNDDIYLTITYYYLVAQTEAGGSFSDSFYAQE